MPILVLIVFVPFWGMAEQFETLTVPTYVDPFAPDSLAPRGAFPLSNLSSSLPIPNIHSAQKSEKSASFLEKFLKFCQGFGSK